MHLANLEDLIPASGSGLTTKFNNHSVSSEQTVSVLNKHSLHIAKISFLVNQEH